MRDVVGGLVLLVLAVGYYLQSMRIPRSTLNDTVGAHGVPQVFAICLGALALALLIKARMGVVMRQPGGDRSAETSNAQGGDPGEVGRGDADALAEPVKEAVAPLSRSILRMLGMLGLGVAYVLLLPWLGYALTLFLLIGAVVLYQGGRAGPGLLVVMVGAAAFFWLIFVKFLGIPLPAGAWTKWL